MVLIEVLLDRRSGETALLQKVYLKTYGRKLLDDITDQRYLSLSSELKECKLSLACYSRLLKWL